VTKIAAGPCWITQIRDLNGDKQVQLAFGTQKHLTKAIAGHVKKAGLEGKQPRFFREVAADAAELTVGTAVNVGEVFAIGDRVEVVGTSKGKGWAGVVKRHGFKGGPRTHGQSDRERAPGSIGQTTTPGRVYRGKRMAGRMGNDRVTARGLTVVSVDAEHNILIVKGLVPGAKSGLVLVQKV
jgi:large subunit ribosomal protein L3